MNRKSGKPERKREKEERQGEKKNFKMNAKGEKIKLYSMREDNGRRILGWEKKIPGGGGAWVSRRHTVCIHPFHFFL